MLKKLVIIFKIIWGILVIFSKHDNDKQLIHLIKIIMVKVVNAISNQFIWDI